MLVAKLYIFHENVSCFFRNKVVFRESKRTINTRFIHITIYLSNLFVYIYTED